MTDHASSSAVLVHDQSPLCRDFASWAGRHLRTGSTMSVDEAAARGLVDPDTADVALWLDGERTSRGHEAIARSLLDMGPVWAWLGRVLDWPGVRSVSAAGYRQVASQRHRILRDDPEEEPSSTAGSAGAADGTVATLTSTRAGGRLGFVRRSIGTTPAADTFVTVALLVAAGVTSRFVHKVGTPAAPAFEHPSVLIGMLATHSKAAVTLAIGFGCLVVRRHLRWDELYDGRRIRWVVMAVALSLAATAGLYSPNYFFGQTYLIDRLIVLTLLALIWIRPASVILFSVFVVATNAQFTYPVGGFTWTHRDLLLNALYLFGILVVLGGGRSVRTMRCFFTGACILLVCAYLSAGSAKVLLGWPWRENLSYLAVGTHIGGWLPGSLAHTVIDILGRLRYVLIAATLVVELGSLALLAGRRVALVVLPALFGLHVFIYLTTGINFLFTWGLLLVALWIYVALGGRAFGRARPALVAWTLLFAFLSPWLFGTYRLAWLDTSYSFSYQLVAVGRSGTRYRVDPADMAPYDVLFAHNFLSYLSTAPTVDTYAWGATVSPALADALARVTRPAQVAAVQARFGRSRSDPGAAARFDELVRSRFRSSQSGWPFHALDEIGSGAPPVVPGTPATSVYAHQEPIVRVEVRLVQVWWDGHRDHVLADCLIRDISVAGGPTRTPDVDNCRLSASGNAR